MSGRACPSFQIKQLAKGLHKIPSQLIEKENLGRAFNPPSL
jgi:hypothetical protein